MLFKYLVFTWIVDYADTWLWMKYFYFNDFCILISFENCFLERFFYSEHKMTRILVSRGIFCQIFGINGNLVRWKSSISHQIWCTCKKATEFKSALNQTLLSNINNSMFLSYSFRYLFLFLSLFLASLIHFVYIHHIFCVFDPNIEIKYR